MGQVIGAGTLSEGQRIPVSLELESGSTNKFVKCTILGPDNQIILDSPFPVPHVSGGTYRRADKYMPNLESIYVKFEVFDDSNWITPSANDGNSADIFTLDKGRITSGAELDGFVDTSELDLMVDVEDVTTKVENEGAEVKVFDENLSGTVEDESAEATVDPLEVETETEC